MDAVTAWSTFGLLVATGFLAWFTWRMAAASRETVEAAAESARAAGAAAESAASQAEVAAKSLRASIGSPGWWPAVELVLENRGPAPAVLSSTRLTHPLMGWDGEPNALIVAPGGTCHVIFKALPDESHPVWPQLRDGLVAGNLMLQVEYTDVIADRSMTTTVHTQPTGGDSPNEVVDGEIHELSGDPAVQHRGTAFLQSNPEARGQIWPRP